MPDLGWESRGDHGTVHVPDLGSVQVPDLGSVQNVSSSGPPTRNRARQREYVKTTKGRRRESAVEPSEPTGASFVFIKHLSIEYHRTNSAGFVYGPDGPGRDKDFLGSVTSSAAPKKNFPIKSLK